VRAKTIINTIVCSGHIFSRKLQRRLKSTRGSRVKGFLEAVETPAVDDCIKSHVASVRIFVASNHDLVYMSPPIGERWDVDFEVLEDGVYDIIIEVGSVLGKCCYKVQLYLEEGETDARTIERLIEDIDELLKR